MTQEPTVTSAGAVANGAAPSLSNPLDVPPARRAAIERIADALADARTVALATHMNADGDGCGSEVALARILQKRGLTVRIVNPTPWPAMFEFLLGDDVENWTPKGAAALKGIDALIVLDISDVKRLGVLADSVRKLAVPKFVVDHHIASDEPPATDQLTLTDTTACATGELVWDIASVLGVPVDEPTARALYTAILTDTGGFRYSNTSPRCHAIAAQLLSAGIDPEAMYRRIYASVSLGKLQLLQEALATLEVDAERGVSWISVPAGAPERFNLLSEDMDGIVEHPRSIIGTRLALFFRDLGHGKVKVSFRSTGDVDVNEFARQYGGGGHAKAAGALVTGSLDEVRARIVAKAQEFVGQR